MKRIVITAALAAAALAIPATPASASHFCTHMGPVEFVKCTIHPVTDLLREGTS